jgi:adenylosuccinate synthase
VLSGLETLKVCTGYTGPTGEHIDEPPLDWRQLAELRPVYDEFPGWTEDITACTAFEQLPANARAYVEYLEDAVGVPVGIVSVGPGRKQTFER